MQKQNPHWQDAGLEIVSQGTERFEINHTHLDHSFKASRCGTKSPPFAESINTCAKLWHVYAGEDSLESAAETYEWLDEDYPVAAMALPSGKSPFDYEWPVADRNLGILSKGKYSADVSVLGHALIICAALHVYGVVNGELTIWHGKCSKGVQ